MDIQIANDPFATIAYMVGYVTKDETEMTKELSQTLAAAKLEPHNEKLRSVATAYLTHRQIGGPEAIYRLIPHMKLKNSNIACIFVASGFPENRSVFYVPVDDSGEPGEKLNANADEIEEVDEVEETQDDAIEVEEKQEEPVQIEGKKGKYRPSLTIHNKYALRPNILEQVTLGQFAICYSSQSRVPAKITFCEETSGDGEYSHQLSDDLRIFNTATYLPLWIKLKAGKGTMKIRTKAIVLRYHLSHKKNGHEEFYSEMLLFSPWRDEVAELHPDSPEDCIEEYKKRFGIIDEVKSTIFPGEKALEKFDFDLMQENKPQHVFDTINPQTEQENDDIEDEELEDDQVEDDLQIAPIHWTGNKEEATILAESSREKAKFRKIPLFSKEDLMELTLKLVPEQKEVLTNVLNLCKSVLKHREKLHLNIGQLLLLVHGGAGKQ